MKKKVFIIFIFIVITILVVHIPVFQTYDIRKNVSQYYLTIASNSPNKIVCILKHQYSTGGGWIVIDSNQESLINHEIFLETTFDPRFLKDNKNFDLDYQGAVIVISNNVYDIVYENSEIKVIDVEKLIVVNSSTTSHYLLKDMSISGILKSFLGIFDLEYRLSV